MEDQGSEVSPEPVYTVLCPESRPHFRSPSTPCRDNDGEVCRRSDCLEGSSVQERVELDYCDGGMVQNSAGQTSSLMMNDRDSNIMQLIRSMSVKCYRIDAPSSQQRHSSAVQCTKVCGVETDGEMTEHSVGKVCRRSDCLEGPNVQQRVEEDDCHGGMVQKIRHTKTCSRLEADAEMTKHKEEKFSILKVTTQAPTGLCQVEESVVGNLLLGHGVNRSEMEQDIAELSKNAPPVKQWVIGPRVQSFKSKMASFTEIVTSPVKQHELNDFSASGTDLAFQNPTLCSSTNDFVNTHKRHSSEGKPNVSGPSQTEGLDKHTNAYSENAISSLRGGRQEFETYEHVCFRAKKGESDSPLQWIPCSPPITRLQSGPDPVESLANNSAPDSSRSGHGLSLCSGASGEQEISKGSQLQCLYTQPTCLSGASPDNHLKVLLSSSKPYPCSKSTNTSSLSVTSLLCNMKEENPGQMKNIGDKDCLPSPSPIRTNEERETVPEDHVITAPLPSSDPVTLTDSACSFFPPVLVESQVESEVRERGKTERSLVPTNYRRTLQATQHHTLHSSVPRFFQKGAHAGELKDRQSITASAKQTVRKTEMEMCQEARVGVGEREVKRENEGKDLEKNRQKTSRELLTVTAGKGGRKRTAISKMPDGCLNVCVDTRRKSERINQNKRIQVSPSLGVGPETESRGRGQCGRGRRKDNKPNVTEIAPTFKKDVNESLNELSRDLTNGCCGYSCIQSINSTSRSILNPVVNTCQARKSKMTSVSDGINQTASEAKIDSAGFDCGVSSSKHSVSHTDITTDSLCRNTPLDTQAEGAQQGVQDHGHEYCRRRKRRMGMHSVMNPNYLALQESIRCIQQWVAPSEMAEENQGGETSVQACSLQIERPHQGTMNSDGMENGDKNQFRSTDGVEEEKKTEVEMQVDTQSEDKEIVGHTSKAHLTIGSSRMTLSSLERNSQPELTIDKPSVFSSLHSRSDIGYSLQSNLIGTSTNNLPQISCLVSSDFVKLEGGNNISKESSCSDTSEAPGSLDTFVFREHHIGKAMEITLAEEKIAISFPIKVEKTPQVSDRRSVKSVVKHSCSQRQGKAEQNGEVGRTRSCSRNSKTISTKLSGDEMIEGENGEVVAEPGKLHKQIGKGPRAGKGRAVKQKDGEREADTHKRRDRRRSVAGGENNAPVEMQKLQKKNDLPKISGSTSLSSRLKRRYSCPEIAPHPVDSPWTVLLSPSSLHSRFPRSPTNRNPPNFPRPSSVKRARRHTVCSLEVEREIAPLCLWKEVYPIVRGGSYWSPSHFCFNLRSSASLTALASCFLSSPLAFLSGKLQDKGSGSSSHNVTSSSSCSATIPTSSSCLSTSSVCSSHDTSSSIPPKYESSPSTSSFCSVPSPGHEESKLMQETAEEKNCFSLGLDSRERCEEKSWSDSEIKTESVKQGEHGKVSCIKIRKTVPKPPNNLTPMGLPKPVRLKKKEFTLEEIYTNKNFRQPPEGRLETIFEVPVSCRDGSLSLIGQRKVKRLVEFPEVGVPRKPRKPLVGTGAGVSRKVGESSGRTRRGGSDKAKEEPSFILQDTESLLCAKLDQLDAWVALDDEDLSV